MNLRKIDSHRQKKYVSLLVLVILHAVGLAGTLYPPTHALVKDLSGINLIVTVFILIWNHRASKRNLAKYFLVSFSVGMLIEIVGVNTGFPFGEYWYGDALGVKILGVPLVIGLNWFYLSYAFAILVSRLPISDWGKAALVASGMVAMDFLIEQVAPGMDFWYWQKELIPLRNYVAWFLVSLILGRVFFVFFNRLSNKIAPYLLIIQIVFFTVLIFAL